MKKPICILLALLLAVAGTAASLAEAGSAWVCPDCGNETSGNFCGECGAARPAEIVCPGCGATYAADAPNRFCTECGAKLPDDAGEPAVALEVNPELGRFATPEDAVQRYIDGLRERDLDKMLSATDWETLESHRTLERMIGRTSTYNWNLIPSFPRDGGFLSAVNIAQMKADTAQQIRQALLNFVATGPDGDGTLKSAATGLSVFLNPEDIDSFIAQFDVARLDSLSGITDVRFIAPEKLTDAYLTESTAKNLEALRVSYGADELRDLCVVFTIDGETSGIFCPGLARYGNVWTMYGPGGMLAWILGINQDLQAFAAFASADANKDGIPSF